MNANTTRLKRLGVRPPGQNSLKKSTRLLIEHFQHNAGLHRANYRSNEPKPLRKLRAIRKHQAAGYKAIHNNQGPAYTVHRGKTVPYGGKIFRKALIGMQRKYLT